MTTRRGFLGSILALGAAPAIVRADALMRVVPVGTLVLNAADVTWSAVDFNRDTIKAILMHTDDEERFDSAVRILYGSDLKLVEAGDIWINPPPRLLFRA